MPGWKGSDRRRELPKDWPAIHARVLKRDHYRCQHVREDTGRKCGRHANQVDHIVRPADGGTDDDRNLRSLCPWHHQQKSSSEGGIASAIARRERRDAAKPLHPGLLASEPHMPRAPF